MLVKKVIHYVNESRLKRLRTPMPTLMSWKGQNRGDVKGSVVVGGGDDQEETEAFGAVKKPCDPAVVDTRHAFVQTQKVQDQE